MKGWLVGSLLIVCALGLLLYFRLAALDSTLRDQQKQIQALEEKLAARSKTDLLDLQERCAKKAEYVFQSLRFNKGELGHYTNHYNPGLQKCFILVESGTTSEPIWIYRTLSDAYELKDYAAYSWHTVKDKKYWEVPPFECHVILPSGEKKVCASDGEFNALIRNYMEEAESKPTEKSTSRQSK